MATFIVKTLQFTSPCAASNDGLDSDPSDVHD